MFKMKMMTLLKNPKIRNGIIVVLVLMMVAGVIAWPKADAQTSISVAFRAASMKVYAGTKDVLMPEVGPGQDNYADKAAKYNNVYCIDEGNDLSYGVYTVEKNFYNSGESSQHFRKYNSAVWLVDNMYISTASDKDALLTYLAELVTAPEVAKNVTGYGTITADNIKALNKIVGSGKDSKGNAINRNLIEVIEQLAIWNYSKNTNGKSDYDSYINAGITGSNITSGDQNACKYLYHALKYLADKNSSYSHTDAKVATAITLDSSKAKIDTEKNQVGPYYLKSGDIVLNANTVKSKISATITTSENKTVELKSDKIKVNSDGSFYIDVTENKDISKSKLNIASIYSGSTIAAQVLVNGSNQNLLNIKKTVTSKPLSDEKTVTVSGKYSVKLIKTEEDGKTPVKNNAATFTLNSVDKATDANGVLQIANDVAIKDISNNAPYTLTEKTAPEGYEKYNGTISLTVHFKKEGTTYKIDKDTTEFKATGTNGKATISYADENTIEIYVPNTKIPDGTYNFVITKKDESGKVITSDETTFNVGVYSDSELKNKVTLKDKDGKEIKTGEIKTVSGILSTIKNINITDDSIDKTYYFLIEETEAPDEYTAIDYRIVVPVKFSKDGSKYIATYGKDAYRIDKDGKKLEGLDKVEVLQNGVTINVSVPNIKSSGSYDFVITKTDEASGETIKEDETTFKVNVYSDDSFKNEVKLIDTDNKEIQTGEIKTTGGILSTIKNIKITSQMIDKTYYFVIEETKAPDEYTAIDYRVVIPVKFSKEGTKYIATYSKDAYRIDKDGKKLEGLDKVVVEQNGIVINVEVPNKQKEFDFSLRKFITNVNDTEVTNRIPQVDLSKLNTIDENNKKITTATYNHTKEPVEVCTSDIVTYTLRVYNEGSTDGYAASIKDDIPEGLEFVPYIKGDGTINDENDWQLLDAEGNKTTDVSKAKYITTDCLSKEKEEAGENLLKAYDKETMTKLDSKDVQVQFKVTEPTTSDRIIINSAQISKETNSKGKIVTDRDSTPDVWNEGEDDQDKEYIYVKYFDLALRKWVTQAIVTENGETKVVETGHKAEDDPESIVKVDLKKSKLNEVTVKFNYSIRVTNQGEIAGYAKEISDYIPAGLKFVQQDNPDWKEVDGKVVTNALANTLLQPGESAEVTILLTWINDANNMGVKINTAEISEDYNDHGAPDIDSTPNNKVPGEDDIDDAPVMLTVKTGSEVIGYVTLGLVVLTIIGTGIIVIKKHIA